MAMKRQHSKDQIPVAGWLTSEHYYLVVGLLLTTLQHWPPVIALLLLCIQEPRLILKEKTSAGFVTLQVRLWNPKINFRGVNVTQNASEGG